jgi:hypothetical protein
MLFKRKGDDAPNPHVPIEDVPGFHPEPPVQSPIAWQQALSVSLSPPAEAEIRRLIGQNRKIQAIKVMREQTGLGLKEAKGLVEAMAAGRPVTTAPSGASLSDQVRAFENSGDHDSAVAIVRAQTGMTAPEAEAFIAALAPGPFA